MKAGGPQSLDTRGLQDVGSANARLARASGWGAVNDM